MKIMIEEWDGDGAIRIPDEALQELELDVGDAVYLIEEVVGNTCCLVLSKTPQIAHRIDELTEAWSSVQLAMRGDIRQSFDEPRLSPEYAIATTPLSSL